MERIFCFLATVLCCCRGLPSGSGDFIEEPCPVLTPLPNTDLIRQPHCASPSECSKALYSCQPGCFFFAGSYERDCSNGTWSEPPLCAKMDFYHNGEIVTNLTLHKGDSAVVECKVLPYSPSTSTITWGEDTRDGDPRNLTIESAKESHSRTYTCTAENDGIEIQKTFTIRVIVDETPIAAEPPKIFVGYPYVHPYGPTIMGSCPCTGSPKPKVTWHLNDTILLPSDNVHVTDNTISQDKITFSQVVITNPTPQHSGLYSCHCSNSAGSVSQTARAPIEIPTETRKKRREVTTIKHPRANICKLLQEESTVTVVGSVLKHLHSADLLHVKVEQSSALEENRIIRVKAGGQSLPIRRSNIMLLRQEGRVFYLQAFLPSDQTLYNHLNNKTLC